VQAICAAIGRADDAVKVLSGVGDVDSAEASFVMWDISRIVQKSRALMTIFDGPTKDIVAAASASNDSEAKAFVSAWNSLIAEHGHRGPNEWDMRSHSWTTNPEITLSMIERLRHQDDARSPYLARTKAASERERIAVELLAVVEGDAETHGTLKAGMASAGLFFSMRERGKSATIRVIHEAKLAFMELGRRMVTEGVIADPQQVFMLLDSELDAFLANPRSFKANIAERDKQYIALYDLEPPYIIKLEEGVPPISAWPKRGGAKTDHGAAKVGDVLQGGAGAPGVVTGIARVVLDPNDPSAVGPGDIMIAPTTDPSWTPLFLAAGGVVVNVGAVASHAAIVCRELGVPCAVSVVDATSRIPDGATVTIDGSNGRVTIDALP
jgi:rifampicin phosphotransferase